MNTCGKPGRIFVTEDFGSEIKIYFITYKLSSISQQEIQKQIEMIEAMTIEATQFKGAAKKILRDAGIIQNTKDKKSSTGQRLFSVNANQ
jgi:hypothetical protein